MKLRDAIALACDQLRASYEDNALYFEILARQVFKTFKSYKLLKTKSASLEVVGGKVLLPDDFVSIVSVDNGCSTDTWCNGSHYAVFDSYISLSSDLEVEDGDIINIIYLALDIDADGEPVIPDTWERMLVAYFCWKYALKHFESYPQYVIMDYKREYSNQKAALL